MIIVAFMLSVVFSATFLAWGYFRAGYESPAKYIFAFGVLWLISRWRRWKWFSSLALLVSLFLSIFGLWFDLSHTWMFSGAIFAFFAWDLNQFQEKLILLPDREDKNGMMRRHLIRIGILALVGLLFGMGLSRLLGN